LLVPVLIFDGSFVLEESLLPRFGRLPDGSWHDADPQSGRVGRSRGQHLNVRWPGRPRSIGTYRPMSISRSARAGSTVDVTVDHRVVPLGARRWL